MTLKEKQLLQQAISEVEHAVFLQVTDARPTQSKNEGPSFGQLMDRVDYLRCVTKYTMLDLEATRREKAALEKKLRGKNK